jgi:hypothetical protein
MGSCSFARNGREGCQPAGHAPLRDAIARGELPGPPILISGEALSGHGDATGTPGEIRASFTKQKLAVQSSRWRPGLQPASGLEVG